MFLREGLSGVYAPLGKVTAGLAIGIIVGYLKPIAAILEDTLKNVNEMDVLYRFAGMCNFIAVFGRTGS